MTKEEIDKILSRLERIDHKEYNCSFEFADSGSFEEICMCFDERKELANYVKKIQQENEQLKEELEMEKQINVEDLKTIDRQQEIIQELKEIIDKYKEAIAKFKDLKTLIGILNSNNLRFSFNEILQELEKGNSKDKDAKR